MREQERFFSGIRIMLQQGYLEIADASFSNKKKTTAKESGAQKKKKKRSNKELKLI